MGEDVLRIESSFIGNALQDHAHRARIQPLSELPVPVHRAEDRAVLDASRVDPAAQGVNGAGCLPRVERQRDQDAFADLVSLRAANLDGRADLDEPHVLDVERHELTPAHRPGETDQHQRSVTLADQRSTIEGSEELLEVAERQRGAFPGAESPSQRLHGGDRPRRRRPAHP